MKKTFLTLILILSLLLGGCGSGTPSANGEASTDPTAQSDHSEVFSNRDFETDYDESKSARIQLSGDSAACDSNAVKINGSTVTITDEGTYILSGTLDNGMIVVDSEKTDKTQLVLDGVTIHSETSAPIYILQSGKVFITLAENSVNTLTNGGSFAAIDENNIDSVIFSKEDLTLNGSGGLQIESPAGHGIVSKDSLTITGGAYVIDSASHALAGKDDVCIAGGSFSITSGKDGIHAENADDETSGYIFIEGGSFSITAEGDGISAASTMGIQGGSFSITTGGGSVNGEKQTSDGWGGFGGGRGGKGGFGAPHTADTDEDSTSIKGVKAGTDLTISGGTFTLDCADDALHSNGTMTINGGTFTVATGDDGFHAEETMTVNAGDIRISESYEGLEALHLLISGGEIDLKASDDGLNAAGGTDASGFGSRDQFGGRGGMSAGNGSITITGGTLYIQASGDGIDANGTLEISGGFTTVCGPTQGDTATLDYDVSGVITGGTFIGTGAANMAQTFSDSGQGVIAVNVGSQAAGTQITLTDSSGNLIISYAPELPFAVVILSSPDMVKGSSYTITVGTASAAFEAG